MVADPRRANQQRMIADYARQGIKFSAALAIQDLMTEAIAQATITQLTAAKTLGPIVNQEINASRGILRERNLKVAERAQNAVVQKYVGRRGSGGPAGYRKNAPEPYRRDAGGKLLKALSSPKFMTVTADGVLFGQEQWLTSQARQWYRLNYGANPNPGRRPSVYNMKFMGGVSTLTLGANQADDGFYIYKGGWSKGGQYTPYGFAMRAGKPPRDASGRFIAINQGLKLTKGVSAWNYLDAGVSVLAKELPLAWERHYRDILKTSAGRARTEAQVQKNRGVTKQTAKRRVNRAADEITRSLKRQR